jgi:hypothetical protein
LLCCCQLHCELHGVQFVDGTIAGLLSWKADSDVLLEELRDRVHFTKEHQVRAAVRAGLKLLWLGEQPAVFRRALSSRESKLRESVIVEHQALLLCGFICQTLGLPSWAIMNHSSETQQQQLAAKLSISEEQQRQQQQAQEPSNTRATQDIEGLW